MNRNIIVGNCKQFTGKAMQAWGRITSDPFYVMSGRRQEHMGSIQERYGRFEVTHRHVAVGRL